MTPEHDQAVGRPWRTTAAGARDLRLVSPLVLLLVVEAVVVLCLAGKLEVGHTTADGARALCEQSQIGILCESCSSDIL